MTTVATYNLFLNSQHRTTGTSSDYTLSLFKPIILTSPNNYFTVRIGSVELPYSFPLITNENNSVNFSFTITGASPVNSFFVIDNGNYNILTLLDQIANKLQAKIYDLTSNLIKFNFTYDRTTGKATFAFGETGAVFLSVTIQDNSPVFMTCIGMTSAFTFTYTNPSTSSPATSTQNVNVTQNTAVYIRSDALAQTTNYENILGKSNISNILGKIQLATTPQSYILWINPTDLEIEINNRVIDTIDIYLGTSTSDSLDLGNLNWSMRITIHEKSRMSRDEQHVDRATNLASTLPILDERAKIVDQLKNLKSKIIS